MRESALCVCVCVCVRAFVHVCVHACVRVCVVLDGKVLEVPLLLIRVKFIFPFKCNIPTMGIGARGIYHKINRQIILKPYYNAHQVWGSPIHSYY